MSKPQSHLFMTTTNTASADRQLALANWVSHELRENTPVELISITNDAGFRRYFRFSSDSKLLAVDAPPETEDTRQFVALARFFRAQGIRTPDVKAADETRGFLLIEDFGDHLLHIDLTSTGPQQTYDAALKTLSNLQHAQDNESLIPRYDRALLRRELDIFREWFVDRMLGYTLDAHESIMLDTLFSQLEDSALAQPQTLVHRDFHSRNLIVCADGGLGVIDFQGALWGAATYDLVSLLRDCYYRNPPAQVRNIALAYRVDAITAGLLPQVTPEQFLRWFDWMGLQRHIKVLGIFARLHLRDNKPGYLNDLPLVIRYTLEVAGQYSELASFTQWFKEKLLPLAQQQHWYSDYHTAGDREKGAL